ncbi:hypothetical protein GCM10027189_28310 [Rufibacter soli]
MVPQIASQESQLLAEVNVIVGIPIEMDYPKIHLLPNGFAFWPCFLKNGLKTETAYAKKRNSSARNRKKDRYIRPSTRP